MKKIKQYNIGLDIGTNSVGWAVTDQNNNLLKRNKKNMWGARLFNSAETAVERRGHRSTRRRMNRRKQRLALLRELMEPMIAQVDPSFYARLAATQLHREDSEFKRTDNFNLFVDKNYNDKHYFAEYPTMYHLRRELMYGRGISEAMDPRLIYLALSHLLKYRGNFLYEEQDLSGITNAFDEEFFSFAELLNESEWLKNNVSLDQIQAIMAILKNTQLYRSEQVKQSVLVFGKLEAKEKKQWEQVFKAIVGLKADAKQLFNESFVNDSGKAISIDLGATSYEETKDALATLLQEDIEVINSLEKMYSWYVLQGVLQGESGLTQAMLAKYEKHMADLKILKTVVREYCDQATYNRMFRASDDKLANYVNYIKKTFVKNQKEKAGKLCAQEDLYKEIKKILKDCDHDERVQQIFADIDKQAFLPKQNSKENGAIPYQLQLQELELILANQSQFYPELAAVQDKIKKIITFRIPYYVGPLTETEKSDFAWVQFKGQGRVYPWNFEELVDRDASAEKFIERMRSTCTYLLGEPVFPRYSLLYNEYTVLNELNKVRINGKLLSVSQKQDIFEKCFKKLGKKTVTRKDIENHCKTNWQPFNQNYTVTGTQDEKGFAANLGSYVDFVKILGEDYVEENPAVIEQLIEWLTVFEDKKIIKRKIMAVYPELEASVAKITRRRYSGWSNLSHKLLAELTTTIDGQKQTIMDVLWETNKNFMQIINDDAYDFKEQIEGQLTTGESKKITYEEVRKLAGSPALKRGIWQTIQIVEEIEKVVGCPPTNIFIEFAREDQASQRTTSRLRQLENLYANMDGDLGLVDLRKELNGKDNQDITKRMFLYFTQNGKCAYSGEALNLENLNTYQVDHILPQSLIKDDSIDNTVLVKSIENQNKADDKSAFEQASPQAKKLWRLLKDAKLMSQRKYNNLTNPNLSQERVKGFINRQLVETRQISKHVAQLLQRSTTANVYSLKATLASQFRSQFGLVKVRAVNDYHHAHDAYLSAVIGNYVQQRYPKLDAEFLYNGYLAYSSASFEKMRKYKYGFIISSMKTAFADGETGEVIMNDEGDIVWRGEEDVAKVRKCLSYKDCFITKKLEENGGQLWNVNPVKKKEGIHSRKSGLDSGKYGGYEGVNSAYSVIYTCERHKGKKVEFKKELLGIPVEYAKIAQQQPERVQAFINEQILEKHEQKGWKVENIQIVREKILKNQLFELDNGLYTLASPTEWNNAKQLILPEEYLKLLAEIGKKQEEAKQVELSEQMNEFYDYFIDKMELYPLSVYVTVKEKLIEKRNEFYNLIFSEKLTVVFELLKITSAKAENANLTSISLASRVARLGGKSLDITDRIFIDQSVTGMYSKKWQVTEEGVCELENGNRN